MTRSKSFFTSQTTLRTGAGGNDLSVQFIEDLGEPLSAAMNVDVLEIKFDATAASVDMEEIRAYITDPANNLDDDITCALLGGTAGTELAPAELFAVISNSLSCLIKDKIKADSGIFLPLITLGILIIG